MGSVYKHKFLYAILGIILASIIGTYFCYPFFFQTSKSPPEPQKAIDLKQQQILQAENNPTIKLTPEQIKVKQKQLQASQ